MVKKVTKIREDGFIYEGQFFKGKMEGFGIFYLDQEKDETFLKTYHRNQQILSYMGNFKKNHFEGKGKLT